MNRTAIYAGTFDPLTLGHLDLVERAASIFDRLIVSVAANPRKSPLFTLEERVAMAREVVRPWSNVEVDAFEGLLIEHARARGVRLILRGLRAFSDFEFEFQMALTNRQLNAVIETLFLMPNENYSYVSSSAVREIATYGGDVSRFVPPEVQQALVRKLGPRAPC